MNQSVPAEILKELRELQEGWDLLTKKYGELRFEVVMAQQAMAEIDATFVDLGAKRNEYVTMLQEQFNSTGTIDLDQGIFVPDQS